MIKAVKIRLKPSKKQEILMFKSVGVSRFTYNWGLNRWSELYSQGVKPSKAIIKKEFNNTIKKQEEFKWLKEVSGQITDQVFDDLDKAFKSFFNNVSSYPRFKPKENKKNHFMLDMMLLSLKVEKLT